MYTTNQLISHPLVAPVLQPSLGGLTPLLILTGGGEILRDEQIYLAHKAACPERHPPSDAYLADYDPDKTLLRKHVPTDVQLQVWDDLCHVAPTLSFTRSAKFMYRSVAQFGAWALARAQNTSIEITDDDDVSVISSCSELESESNPSSEKLSKVKAEGNWAGQIGRAGDPLPAFHNHMIRQRVDRHGNIYSLAPAHELPALQIPASDIGVIKPGPVRKWFEANKEWDRRYAREKRRVQKQPVKEMGMGGSERFGVGEQAHPSALAGRKRSTKSREEGVMQEEESEKTSIATPEKFYHDTTMQTKRSTSAACKDRSLSRRRAVTVTDARQTEGWERGYHKAGLQKVEGGRDALQARNETSTSTDPSKLGPRYNPPKSKNKNLAMDHLKDDDTASITTGVSGADVESLRNASTTAVFAAPGLLSRERKATNASKLSGSVNAGEYDDGTDTEGIRSEVASMVRPETPVSRRSIERLQSHQDAEMALRSPSAVAVVRMPGVMGVVDGDGNEPEEKSRETW